MPLRRFIFFHFLYCITTNFYYVQMAGGRKAKPTVINGDGFRGERALSTQELERMTVTSPDDIATKIADWDRGIGAGIVCRLSNDNRRVVHCHIALLGDLFTSPKKISINNAFEKFPSLQIVLSSIDCSIFKFTNKLVSDYVDSSAISYDFVGPSGILNEQVQQAGGLHGFALRVHIVPITQECARLTLVLYPTPLASLTADHGLAKSPAFPGLKLFGGDIPFLPLARTILESPWGCPLLPAILLGCEEPNVFPTSADLRAAISGLLRSAQKPTLKAGYSTLLPMWESLKDKSADALSSPPLESIWPDSGTPSSPPPGSCLCLPIYEVRLFSLY